jgi:hypothetical protein
MESLFMDQKQRKKELLPSTSTAKEERGLLGVPEGDIISCFDRY